VLNSSAFQIFCELLLNYWSSLLYVQFRIPTYGQNILALL